MKLSDELAYTTATELALRIRRRELSPVEVVEAYIERLVVSPDFRRQGMARRLLLAAEDLARDSGKASVGLHVSGNNLAALRLYEGEGYEEVSRQRSLLTGYFLNIKDWLYLQKRV